MGISVYIHTYPMRCVEGNDMHVRMERNVPWLVNLSDSPSHSAGRRVGRASLLTQAFWFVVRTDPAANGLPTFLLVFFLLLLLSLPSCWAPYRTHSLYCSTAHLQSPNVPTHTLQQPLLVSMRSCFAQKKNMRSCSKIFKVTSPRENLQRS
jgi:hypothetical protein